MQSIKKRILLRTKLLRNFLLQHELDFPIENYHLVNRLLIELDRFDLSLKTIHHKKFYSRRK